MPTIGAAVSAETKDRFDVAAAVRETTPSRLAGRLITDFLQVEVADPVSSESSTLQQAPEIPGRMEARTEQVFVRLEPHYFDELGRLARAKDWYRGTYLANLFHAHADRRPVLCEAEINAVRQVARQLADLGRNMNQIAKKLNMSITHTHLVTAADFELIKMLLDLETTVVKDLMRANMRGWGVGHDET
jgi:hypothetical protein